LRDRISENTEFVLKSEGIEAVYLPAQSGKKEDIKSVSIA
jgi:hypothetical protein